MKPETVLLLFTASICFYIYHLTPFNHTLGEKMLLMLSDSLKIFEAATALLLNT